MLQPQVPRGYVSLTLQVTEETSSMRFNTGIAAMMEFVNGAYKWEQRPKAALEQFVLLLAPYAPHLSEEMWQVLQTCSALAPVTLQHMFSCRASTCMCASYMHTQNHTSATTHVLCGVADGHALNVLTHVLGHGQRR